MSGKSRDYYAGQIALLEYLIPIAQESGLATWRALLAEIRQHQAESLERMDKQ